jgi:hypothetical protein
MLLKRLLTVKIASCPTFEAAAEKVVEQLSAHNLSSTIALWGAVSPISRAGVGGAEVTLGCRSARARGVPRSCDWLRSPLSCDWRTAGALMFLARCASPCWPCSPLLRFRDSVPPASLSTDSRATPSPSEVHQRCAQTLRGFCLPRLASYLAIRQERCGVRQCFWACIAAGPPLLPISA